MLRAATACAFSTSQLRKVIRRWCVLCILTWKCASRHNGVQLFIPHLTTCLRTRRFSEPTFRTSATIGKKHLLLLSSHSYPSLIFSRLFSSLTLPTSAFSSVYIVGILTSKLPSIVHKNVFRIKMAVWGYQSVSSSFASRTTGARPSSPLKTRSRTPSPQRRPLYDLPGT